MNANAPVKTEQETIPSFIHTLLMMLVMLVTTSRNLGEIANAQAIENGYGISDEDNRYNWRDLYNQLSYLKKMYITSTMTISIVNKDSPLSCIDTFGFIISDKNNGAPAAFTIRLNADRDAFEEVNFKVLANEEVQVFNTPEAIIALLKNYGINPNIGGNDIRGALKSFTTWLLENSEKLASEQ